MKQPDQATSATKVRFYRILIPQTMKLPARPLPLKFTQILKLAGPGAWVTMVDTRV